MLMDVERENLLFALLIEQAFVNLHTQGQSELLELALDFVQRFLSKITVFEHLLLALHSQFTNGCDVGIVQTVRGTDRKLDLIHTHVEQLAEAVLFFADLLVFALKLNLLLAHFVEHVEVMLEDRSGMLDRILRGDTAIRGHFKDQTIVIGHLPNTGIFNRVFDVTDRAEKRIDRNHTDCLIFFLVVIADRETTAHLNLQLGVELLLAVQMTEHLLRVEDGVLVWRGAFDRTQSSLMEDILQIASFYREKARWVTAKELAEEGVEKILETFPGLP